jgi:hypothetical protein
VPEVLEADGSKPMQLESVDDYEEEELPNIYDMQALVLEMCFKLGELEKTLSDRAIKNMKQVILNSANLNTGD